MSEEHGGELHPETTPPVVYPDDPDHGRQDQVVSPPPALVSGGGNNSHTPPKAGSDDDDDDEEGGMLRMSFMEHLEELRSRILKALGGIVAAFLLCIIFANEMWKVVSEPATLALQTLGFTPKLVQISPMETFSTVWVKLPLLASIFVASPWVVYQVWAFVAPGLYPRERRLAAPFILTTAGLFISGGLFAYFVAFRFGLTFLLGIGRDINIQPMVSITEYFSLFVNVILGVALVFELPVVIFFLTLLRIASPAFLLRNSRYAILIIVLLAAVVTPTPDVFNLMLFAVPMCLLYFLGVFASYLLVLRRENRRFPWSMFLIWLGVVFALAAGIIAVMILQYGYYLVPRWPFLAH
jgi:sec-independent protein translocase protein TatC